MGGERLVEVDEHGTRHVAGVIGLAPDAAVQVGAHVGGDGALGDLRDDGIDHASTYSRRGCDGGFLPESDGRRGVLSGMKPLLLTALATAFLVLACA